jgi:hypothetical protein
MFASDQLLPIAMATFTLSLVLAAGVFSRTFASWIVAGIEQAEPMMHFVAKSDEEAHFVTTKLLNFEVDSEGSTSSMSYNIPDLYWNWNETYD